VGSLPCNNETFEAIDMARIAMALQVKDILSSYNLLDKLFAHVKDEGDNLSTLAQAMSFVVSCVPLTIITPYQRSYFGHVFSKACQYATNDAIVCFDFQEVSLKAT
jgi:hypothetical protein